MKKTLNNWMFLIDYMYHNIPTGAATEPSSQASFSHVVTMGDGEGGGGGGGCLGHIMVRRLASLHVKV